MCRNALILATLCFCFAGVASADSATYMISVNTSSIAGTSGSLDFQFNPGAMSQAADVQVLGFTSNGSLGGAATIGDASGTLPGTVSFDNGTAFNDYFTGFTYGTTLTFDVSLFGPALTSPDGTSSSGSSFAFNMFSDAAGTMPTLTSDTTDGFAMTIDVNLDGTTTLKNFSTETSAGPLMITTPEPGTLLLMAAGLAGIVTLRFRVRRTAIYAASSADET
jgi:hypothetical protein